MICQACLPPHSHAGCEPGGGQCARRLTERRDERFMILSCARTLRLRRTLGLWGGLWGRQMGRQDNEMSSLSSATLTRRLRTGGGQCARRLTEGVTADSWLCLAQDIALAQDFDSRRAWKLVSRARRPLWFIYPLGGCVFVLARLCRSLIIPSFSCYLFYFSFLLFFSMLVYVVLYLIYYSVYILVFDIILSLLFCISSYIILCYIIICISSVFYVILCFIFIIWYMCFRSYFILWLYILCDIYIYNYFIFFIFTYIYYVIHICSSC